MPQPLGRQEPAAAVARRLRHRIAHGGNGPAEWRAYAIALARLGFRDRAALASERAGDIAVRSPPPPPRAGDRQPVRIFVSGYTPPPDESEPAALTGTIGAAHYSYGFAMRNFLEALGMVGVPFTHIRHPEFVADIDDRSDAAINIHLGFYPPEQLRLLKGAYNILCSAWEFDRLRSSAEVLDPHAFADQATMLNRLDALWMPSRHGAAAVARDVAVPVQVVPAPLVRGVATAPRHRRPTIGRLAQIGQLLAGIGWQPLAILPRLQGAMDRTAALERRGLPRILEVLSAFPCPTLFVTILNVHDYRKQLRPMLQAFATFAHTHPGAILLVKCSTPAAGRHAINDLLRNEQISAPGEPVQTIVSDRIWITEDLLTRAEMTALYDAAAFYVCTAYAEGQNLPLLEAMGRGAVPVSVDHTAMADYIRPDNAVPIRSTRRAFDIRLTRRYGLFGLETNHVAVADVHAALVEAMAIGDTAYAARSAAALATVRDHFGASRLTAAVRDAVEAARSKATHG